MGKAGFVIVEKDYQLPEDDELWEIYFDDRGRPSHVILGPIYVGSGGEEEVIFYYGEELGKKIWDAYDMGKAVPISERTAREILEVIDDYHEFEYGKRTKYAKTRSVWRLKV
jgi:hypothetical protein